MEKFDYKIFNVNHKFTVLGVPYELIICDEDDAEYGAILDGRSNFHEYRLKKILLHNHVTEYSEKRTLLRCLIIQAFMYESGITYLDRSDATTWIERHFDNISKVFNEIAHYF